METLWLVEASWIDTSHGEDCDTCKGLMLARRMVFQHGSTWVCVCPSAKEDTECVCVVREATLPEKAAYRAGRKAERLSRS